MRRRRKKKASELTSFVDVLFILLFAALVQARGVAARDDGSAPTQIPTDDLPDAAALNDAGLDAGPEDGGGGLDAEPGPDAMASDASARDALTGDASSEDVGDGDRTSHSARSLEVARTMASAIGNQPVAIVEITATGQLAALTYWREGRELRRDELHYPLLYQRPVDDDFEYDYRGQRNERHRLCAIVRDHFTGASAGLSPGPPDAGADTGADAGATPGVVTSVDISEMVVFITLDAPLAELPWALRRGLEFDAKRCFNDFGGLAILIRP